MESGTSRGRGTTAVLHTKSSASAVGPGLIDGLPTRVNLLARPRLLRRLDEAVRTTRLVIVGSASGSGKTTLVASWASQLAVRAQVRWLDLHQVSSVSDVLDRLAVETGLSSPGGAQRRIVVLDDFPLRPEPGAVAALERLVRGPHDLAVVLVCAGTPRLDPQRLGVPAELRVIDSAELAMRRDEIAETLTRSVTDPAPILIEELGRRTCGWAWGVRRGAELLAGGCSAAAALHETSQAIADYLADSVLTNLSDAAYELISRTSVVERVPADLAAVAGSAAPIAETLATQTRGFVQVRADGSFQVHPLLRRHLLSRLRRRPDRALIATRRAAQASQDRGDLDGAIAIAADGGDWDRAAQLIVAGLRIPALLAGGASPLLDQAEAADGLGTAEPLLLAVAALRRTWPEAAARAIRAAPPIGDSSVPGGVAARLSRTLVEMSLARWEADPQAGLRLHQQATSLLPGLSVAQRASAPELQPLLASQLAGFEEAADSPERARVALERGARAFRPKPATEEINAAAQVAAAACLGQLAWLEAVGGELTHALQHAASVLAARAADSDETGVVYAQLAAVWCQVSRDQLEQAAQRFTGLTTRRRTPADAAFLPELTVAIGLTAARLATATGRDHGWVAFQAQCHSSPYARQFEHRLALIQAEAELAAGQPMAALRLLDDDPQDGDSQALRARAWIQLGDLGSVAAAMRVRPVEALSLLTRVQLQLVEAWLAREHGDRARQRTLIDRALRTAAREQLRSPLAWTGAWLREAIRSDAVLLQQHGSFVAALRQQKEERPDGGLVAPPIAAPTQREIEILRRLGTLSTNEEIAAELYLSPNTVKTHLKGLYRKLEVTRRSDAFRKGRALGLC